MKKWGGVTLLEILVVVMVIGILVAIALPNFSPMRENVLNKEAIASLKLIQAAEKIYRMEASFYFPYSGTESTIANINSSLKLVLPADNTRKWNYRCKQYAGAPESCADATRFNGPDTRSWRLQMDEAEPISGTCP